MAKEYIEREAVRIAYDRSYKANTHNLYVAKAVHAQEHRRILHLLDKIPAADVVEVVRGCWVGTADGYADGELVYDMWECSECGYDADGAEEKPNWNFRPNCGAKMSGGNDHED